MIRAVTLKVFAFIFTLLFSVTTHASSLQLNKFVILGDSLSDNGNLYQYMKQKFPPSPPYYQGRFTNGRVWVEDLAEAYYGADWPSHLLDYAFGGAGVLNENSEGDETLFSLDREIDSYLLAHQNHADGQSLFIIWIGVNNYLYLMNPDNMDETVQSVNAGIKTGLQRLVDSGAKHLLVINLPDLSKSPAARAFETTEALAYCTNKNNAVLDESFKQLQAQYPQVQWLFFDANALFQSILEHPNTFGFANVTETCLTVKLDPASLPSILSMVANPSSQLQSDHACDGYLFFDPVHPTALAHQIMAERVGQLLKTTLAGE